MNSEKIAAIRQSAVTHKHIAGGEQIARATIGAINAPGLQLEGVDWVDCIVERCLVSGATLIDSRFEGVLFHDCDFTGLTFANCLLRDCVIVGAIDEVEIWDAVRWREATEVGDSLLESPDQFIDGAAS